MAWAYLIAAGLCEVAWAVGLKYSAGFSRLVPAAITAVGIVLSVGLLGLAIRSVPLGTAYAVWTGIGALGTAALGIYLFDEPATALRLASMAALVAGILGLRLAG